VRKDVYVAAGGEEKRADILNLLEFFDQTTWINKTNLNRQVTYKPFFQLVKIYESD
jgi:hypothetical protein